jgi:hypothetical protein
MSMVVHLQSPRSDLYRVLRLAAWHCDRRGLSSDEEDEEDEEDPAEEEAPKELPVIQPAKPPAVKRRTSVSAESLDPAKVRGWEGEAIGAAADRGLIRVWCVLCAPVAGQGRGSQDPEE